jgi:hypothetical protein
MEKGLIKLVINRMISIIIKAVTILIVNKNKTILIQIKIIDQI